MIPAATHLTAIAMMNRHSTGDRIRTYTLCRPLGRGGMGEVWAATDPSGKMLALKRIEGGAELGTQRFMKEVALLRRVTDLEHPHLLRFVDFDVDEDGEPFMVTELLEGDSLAVLLALLREGDRSAIPPMGPQSMPLPVFQDCAYQLASALAALHSLGCAHRDLKPENVVTTTRAREVLASHAIHLKLIDFGIGLSSQGRRLTRDMAPGTLDYIAPEVLVGAASEIQTGTQREAESVAMAKARDMFALGLLLYELWTKKRFWQFRGDGLAVAFGFAMSAWQAQLASFQKEAGGRLRGCPYQGLVVGLLSENPSHRPSAADALATLQASGGMPAETVESLFADAREAGSSTTSSRDPLEQIGFQEAPAPHPTLAPIERGQGSHSAEVARSGLGGVEVARSALSGVEQDGGSRLPSFQAQGRVLPSAAGHTPRLIRWAVLSLVLVGVTSLGWYLWPLRAPLETIPPAGQETRAETTAHEVDGDQASMGPAMKQADEKGDGPSSRAGEHAVEVAEQKSASKKVLRAPVQPRVAHGGQDTAWDRAHGAGGASGRIRPDGRVAERRSEGSARDVDGVHAPKEPTLGEGAMQGAGGATVPRSSSFAPPGAPLTTGGLVEHRSNAKIYQASSKGASVMALGGGQVWAVTGCQPPSTGCTVDVVHDGRYLSRYVGLAVAEVSVDQTLARGAEIGRLSPGGRLTVTLYVRQAGGGWAPLPAYRWKHTRLP